MWDAEDSAVPPAQDAFEQDQAADKARIAKLEKEVARLTKFIYDSNGVREQLKWMRGGFVWAEKRYDEFDERLRGLEDFFGMPTGAWQGVTLYDGQDVTVVHRMRSAEERKERDAQLLAAYEMTEEEKERRERRRKEEYLGSDEEGSENENKEGEDESGENEGREAEASWVERGAAEVERDPPSKRLRPPTAETSPVTSRTPSSPGGSQSTSPTADLRMEADSPHIVPSASAHSATTPPNVVQVPALNVILATPQSSQHPSQSQTAAPVPTVYPEAGPSLASSGAESGSPVAHAQTQSPHPWRVNTNEATGTNSEALLPPAQSVVARPPASTLLAVPPPDLGTSNSPCRSRSRSPSPGPICRSPQLQSPLPQGSPPAPAAQSTDGESGALMNVDK